MKNWKIFGVVFVMLIPFFIFIGVSIFVSGSHAIYSDSNNWDYSYISGRMYISSDRLDKNGIVTIENYYDFYDVDFVVNNFLNSGQISTNRINYNVSCVVDEGYSCYIDDMLNSIDSQIDSEFECVNGNTLVSDLDEVSCKDNGYIYKSVMKSNTHRIKIIKNDININDNKINVSLELNTTYPFGKKLVGNILLNVNDDKDYYSVSEIINNGDNSCNVLVESNYSVSKIACLNIINSNNYFDTDINLDNGESITGSSYCFNIGPNSSKNILLYKKDSNIDCSVNDFNVQENE